MPRYRDPRRLPEEVEQLDKSIAELEEKIATLKLQREQLLDERALIRRLPP